MALGTLHPVEFHIDPHTKAKSITGSGDQNHLHILATINQADIDHFTAREMPIYEATGVGDAIQFEFGYGVSPQNKQIFCTIADAVKIRGFFRGVAVEVDANGLQINADPEEDMTEAEAVQVELDGVKRQQNNLALSIAALIRSREAEVSRIYGGWRLEVIAATDTTPLYADLFGLEVIDPDPANEATDTIVCAINMVGANMCQHKQFPDMPNNNQWVIEALTADGKAHRFHTHSAGDFGRIFDAIRAGVTTKVYSTRPTTPDQPAS